MRNAWIWPSYALTFMLIALNAAYDARAQSSQSILTLVPDTPRPNVGDGVRLETDVLTRPPYNEGGYEVWFWFCRDSRERCRDSRNWLRMPVTNAQGDTVRPATVFVCRSGNCTQRVRLSNPREADYFFVAALYRSGQFVARSPLVTVSWRKSTTSEQKPPAEAITLTITANGATCTAKLGNNGTSRRYPQLIDRCLAESPGGAVLRIAPNGSTPNLQVTARFTGLEEPQYSLVFLWGGFHPCPGNPCSMTFPTVNPNGTADFIDRAIVGVMLHYDHTKGVRARVPSGALFDGLQAEASVDFRR
jgi:hypothetical protein